MKKILLIVLGPTAIGKTALSIELAKLFNTDIISADSRQIYRELSIGTAIPNPQQLNTVKHHFIQSHSINDYYNVSNYETEVLAKLNLLFENKDIVIMTGGSMMYIDVICNGIDDLPTIDETIRKEIIDRYEESGIETIRRELKNIDPEYYDIVDLKNPKRIMHALEVFYMTGKKYSSFRSNTTKTRDFSIIKIGLDIDRNLLHQHINQRVDEMINNGLINEAQSLIPFRDKNSLNTVGYKELFDYFDGKTNLDEAIELIKRNTRRYARRQLTWFRRDKSIYWFSPLQQDEIIEFVTKKFDTNS
jgi:tRNA dimethylallyltransferase